MNKDTPSKFKLNEGVSRMWRITLKQRVQFLSASRGWTQNYLADLIGITHGTLSKILSKDWLPTAKIKLLMAKHLM